MLTTPACENVTHKFILSVQLFSKASNNFCFKHICFCQFYRLHILSLVWSVVKNWIISISKEALDPSSKYSWQILIVENTISWKFGLKCCFWKRVWQQLLLQNTVMAVLSVKKVRYVGGFRHFCLARKKVVSGCTHYTTIML